MTPEIERLKAELSNLRYQDLLNMHADNSYFISGRHDQVARAIREAERALEKALNTVEKGNDQ